MEATDLRVKASLVAFEASFDKLMLAFPFPLQEGLAAVSSLFALYRTGEANLTLFLLCAILLALLRYNIHIKENIK